MTKRLLVLAIIVVAFIVPAMAQRIGSVKAEHRFSAAPGQTEVFVSAKSGPNSKKPPVAITVHFFLDKIQDKKDSTKKMVWLAYEFLPIQNSQYPNSLVEPGTMTLQCDGMKPFFLAMSKADFSSVPCWGDVTKGSRLTVSLSYPKYDIAFTKVLYLDWTTKEISEHQPIPHANGNSERVLAIASN